MTKVCKYLVGTCVFLFATYAQAIPIILTNAGSQGGSTIFSADLNAAGVTSITNIVIVDDDNGIGGAAGIFSGADIDAVFLDADGSLATDTDRIFASSYAFSAGTTRATSDPNWLPNASHPGPTFGSLDASTIDLATATLDLFDGVSIADVDLANGFLTLGDGGSLTAFFNPAVTVSGTLFLLVGEVGLNESLGAEVAVNVSEPATLLLFGLGILALGISRRRT